MIPPAARGRIPLPGAALLLTSGLALILCGSVGALPGVDLPPLVPAGRTLVTARPMAKPPAADTTAAARARATAADPTDTRATADTTPAAPHAAQAAVPVRLRIPAIGVDADVMALGLQLDRTLEVPEDPDRTGWWRGGPEPGEVGAAVVVGHVDSWRGPAVFSDLVDLRRGDAILVDRADGSTATFVVRSSMAVGKDTFPTRAVYGPADTPALRLVTCHGDVVGGSHTGNYVILADLQA